MCNTNPNNFKSEVEYLNAVHGIQPVIANPMQTFQCGKCGTQNLIPAPICNPPQWIYSYPERENCIPKSPTRMRTANNLCDLEKFEAYGIGFRDGYRSGSNTYNSNSDMSCVGMLGISVLILACAFFVVCGIVACLVH